LGHLDIALALETTIYIVFFRLSVKPDCGQAVEQAYADNIEAHVQIDTIVDGNIDDGEIVEQVSICGKRVDVRPPTHMAVDHERSCETYILIELDQVSVRVLTLYLVD